METNPTAMLSGRALLRFLDEELAADQQLEVNALFGEWLRMKPKGHTPDHVDEFLVTWVSTLRSLTMVGQNPPASMVRSLFLEKVEPFANFAAADFAIWKRAPPGHPLATVDALITAIRDTCRRYGHEHQYKDRSSKSYPANVGVSADGKTFIPSNAVSSQAPAYSAQEWESGNWDDDWDMDLVYSPEDAWMYDEGEAEEYEEGAVHVATFTKGKGKKKGKGRKGKSKGKGKKSSKGVLPDPRPAGFAQRNIDGKKPVCFRFQRGTCPDGASCKYAHEKSSIPPYAAKSKGKARRPSSKGTPAIEMEVDWESGTPEVAPGDSQASALVLPMLVCEALVQETRTQIKWVVDSGAGIHIVPHPSVDGGFEAPPITILTANGTVVSRTMTEIPCPQLQGKVQAYVLPNSPYVLSLGRLQSKGFSFLWKPKKNPVLIRPDRTVVHLEVCTDVPMFAQSIVCIAAQHHGTVVSVLCPQASGPAGAVEQGTGTAVPGIAASQDDVEPAELSESAELVDDFVVGPARPDGADLSIEEFTGDSTSPHHMLTHEPKARDCPVCLRSRLRRTPARRRVNPVRATEFGGRWSIDHIGLGPSTRKE
ncbi:MAG: hypothetical protein EOP33_09200 [Rickettsiaceae bacterium]|nr:MAG: hypothetical protein EOP33_09200 [Rickettsiaceae bacterium]